MKNFTILILLLFFVAGCKKDSSKIPVVDKSLNQKSVGTSANDFLSGSRYSTVKIEIQYMPGFQPEQGSVSQLVSFLNANLNKPLGIQVLQKEIPATGKASLTTQDVVAIEQQYRTVYTSDNQLGVYLLITDANYNEPNILGFAYRNTSIGLFGPIIRDNSNRVNRPSRQKLESTVLNHEFGHLLGLVNIGSPMVNLHEDPSHPNHCNNNQCLMYYASNTTQVMGMIMNTTVPDLDQNCKNDLKANGGK